MCYEFTFKLTYDEAYEAFFLIADKWGYKRRTVLIIILTLLGIFCNVMYALNPYGLDLLLISLFTIALLFFAVYAPYLKAAKGAKNVVRRGGVYVLYLYPDGTITMRNGDKMPLSGDKDARAFETNKIFAIRPDRYHSFCIPKHAIAVSDITAVREIIRLNIKNNRLL